jgi:hypothetical protein
MNLSVVHVDVDVAGDLVLFAVDHLLDAG